MSQPYDSQSNINDRLHAALIESTSTPGQAAMAVVNPDGTDVSGGGGGGAQFNRDSPAGLTDLGTQALVVRKDVGGTLVGADGDYTPLQVDSSGNLRVTGGGGGAQFARDSVAGAADLGTQTLVVRNDAGGSLVGADGDYTPLQTDSSGNLRVTGGAQFARDSAAGATDLGTQSLAVRKDIGGTLVGADGDYTPLQTTAEGFLRVSISNVVTSTQTFPTNNPIYSYDTDTNLAATASRSITGGTSANIFSATVHNNSGSDHYFQIFNQATPPVNTDVPQHSILVPSGQQIIIGTDYFGVGGINCNNGLAVGMSLNRLDFSFALAADTMWMVNYK